MTPNFEKMKAQIHEELIAGLDFSKETADDEIYEMIDDAVVRHSKNEFISLEEKKQLRKSLFHSMRKLDVLQNLVDDPTVTEIMINGPDDIFIEKSGRLSRYQMSFGTSEKLMDVVQRIVSSCNRVVNESSPIVDARLSNGSRVNIVLNPVALNGPILTIRRFPDDPITMEKLLSFGSISEEICHFLKALVQAGYNVFISGGTGSGKTTFLNALSDYIPKDERVITIEDNAELQIKNVPNIVRMESRNANVEGCKEITIRDLIKSSLRMRPDRIVVGEVRGDECVDMLQAMNTGHIAMSTGHANTARDMLSRLETMTLMGMDIPLVAIRGQIASGIDIIVHLGRLRDRTRKLLEICELTGEMDAAGKIETRTLYRFVETSQEAETGKIIGEWVKENELTNDAKLKAAGIVI